MTDKIFNLASEIIKYFEGCELKSYQDTAGIWTIGVGHTKEVKANQVINDEKANEFLKEDLRDSEKRVKKATPQMNFTDYEFAALLSQAFNLRSFELLASHLKISIKRYKDKSLLYCNDVAGHKLNGLLIRRICERFLFENREWLAIAQDLQSKSNLDYTIQKQKELFI